MIRRNFAMLATAILILVVGVAAFLYNQQKATPQPSNEDFLQAITRRFPDFTENNKPVIAIDSISRHDHGWYVVIIRSLNEVEVFVPVRLLLVESDDKLSVVLGPSAHFTDEDLKSHKLPDSVILELQK